MSLYSVDIVSYIIKQFLGWFFFLPSIRVIMNMCCVTWIILACLCYHINLFFITSKQHEFFKFDFWMLLPYTYLEKGCVKHTSMPYSVSLLFVKSSWELILTCVVSFCLQKSDIQVPFSDRNSMFGFLQDLNVKCKYQMIFVSIFDLSDTAIILILW